MRAPKACPGELPSMLAYIQPSTSRAKTMINAAQLQTRKHHAVVAGVSIVQTNAASIPGVEDHSNSTADAQRVHMSHRQQSLQAIVSLLYSGCLCFSVALCLSGIYPNSLACALSKQITHSMQSVIYRLYMEGSNAWSPEAPVVCRHTHGSASPAWLPLYLAPTRCVSHQSHTPA